MFYKEIKNRQQKEEKTTRRFRGLTGKYTEILTIAVVYYSLLAQFFSPQQMKNNKVTLGCVSQLTVQS